jgi:hypothetical protein
MGMGSQQFASNCGVFGAKVLLGLFMILDFWGDGHSFMTI